MIHSSISIYLHIYTYTFNYTYIKRRKRIRTGLSGRLRDIGKDDVEFVVLNVLINENKLVF